MKKNLRILFSGTLAAVVGFGALALADSHNPEPLQPGEERMVPPDVAYAIAGGSFGAVTVTNGASSLNIVPNGNTIWDFDGTQAAAGDPAVLRFFRHTTTTAVVSLFIYNGLASATALIAGNAPSYFRNLVGFGTDTPHYKVDVQALDETHNTENRLVNVDTLNSTFDTTAAPLTAYGAYFYVHSARSAGAAPLSDIGLYASAEGGDVNYAGLFGPGDVRVNSHLLGGGAPATVTGCGTGGAVVGDDKSGTITEGTSTTGCSVVFAQAYGAAPACVVRTKAGLPIQYNVTATGITITNVGTQVRPKIDYICQAI